MIRCLPDGKPDDRKTINNVLDFCVTMLQEIGISEFTQMDDEGNFNGGRTYQ